MREMVHIVVIFMFAVDSRSLLAVRGVLPLAMFCGDMPILGSG